MTTVREQQVIIDAEVREREKKNLRDFLTRDGYIIPAGTGEEDAPCSIAAINLVLDEEFTDTIREGMSVEIGYWIREVQDAMPEGLRNSMAWKMLLVETPWTDINHEVDIRRYQQNWLFTKVVDSVREIATYCDLKDEWVKMMETQRIDDVVAVQDKITVLLEKWKWDAPSGKKRLVRNLNQITENIRLMYRRDFYEQYFPDAIPEHLELFDPAGVASLTAVMAQVYYLWDYYTGILDPGQNTVETRLGLQNWLYQRKFEVIRTLKDMIDIAEGRHDEYNQEGQPREHSEVQASA